jgi:hypothetical protein
MTIYVVFDEPTAYHRADYQTASGWTRYEIQPGRYPVEMVHIDYRPCPADQRPYHALVRLDVRVLESYYENRLLWATSAERKVTPDAPVEQLTRSTYAYTFEDSHYPQRDGRPAYDVPRVTTFLGGRVEYDVSLAESH